MPDSQVTAAFATEAGQLAAIAGSLTEADLARPSPCPPWTAGELLCHIVVAVQRIGQAAAAVDSFNGGLVTAAGYYRPDQRFSPEVDATRIKTAQVLSRALGSAASISAAFEAAWRSGHAILLAAHPDRIAATRHGDRMLLTDFAVTRVVEVAVHGIDLAAGLDRPPWLTPQAADVLEHLLVPGDTARQLQSALGCDRVGLIALLTGRRPMTDVQAALVDEHAVTRLALG
jgi:uncharacterized protein (TIGR03083 family)